MNHRKPRVPPELAPVYPVTQSCNSGTMCGFDTLNSQKFQILPIFTPVYQKFTLYSMWSMSRFSRISLGKYSYLGTFRRIKTTGPKFTPCRRTSPARWLDHHGTSFPTTKRSFQFFTFSGRPAITGVKISEFFSCFRPQVLHSCNSWWLPVPTIQIVLGCMENKNKSAYKAAQHKCLYFEKLL